MLEPELQRLSWLYHVLTKELLIGVFIWEILLQLALGGLLLTSTTAC